MRARLDVQRRLISIGATDKRLSLAPEGPPVDPMWWNRVMPVDGNDDPTDSVAVSVAVTGSGSTRGDRGD